MAKTPEQLREWIKKQEGKRHGEKEGLLLSAESLSYADKFHDEFKKARAKIKYVDLDEAFGVPKKRPWFQVLRDLLK